MVYFHSLLCKSAFSYENRATKSNTRMEDLVYGKQGLHSDEKTQGTEGLGGYSWGAGETVTTYFRLMHCHEWENQEFVEKYKELYTSLHPKWDRNHKFIEIYVRLSYL